MARLKQSPQADHILIRGDKLGKKENEKEPREKFYTQGNKILSLLPGNIPAYYGSD
jgi:hypothetical protein